MVKIRKFDVEDKEGFYTIIQELFTKYLVRDTFYSKD